MSAADAVLALLRAVPNLNVHDGYVADSDESSKTISAPLPYVIVFFRAPSPINPRLGSNGRRSIGFQVTGVGSTREQASWAAQKAEDALDWTLIDIDGRPRRIRRDNDEAWMTRDDVWTRPDGGPLFNDARRYVTRT